MNKQELFDCILGLQQGVEHMQNAAESLEKATFELQTSLARIGRMLQLEPDFNLKISDDDIPF